MNSTATVMAQAADIAEFEHLLARHPGIIAKVAASYAFDPEDRADLAQEIRLQLWRAWPGYDRSRPFATWMYRVALNVAISHGRQRRAQPAHEALGEAHEQLVGADDVDAETRQQLDRLQRAMQALPPLDRALLVLHLDGCSHREIAEVLGISEANAGTRLGRIRERLRRRLRLFSLAQGLQLLAGVAIVLMAGPWWVRHWGEWHLVAYGVAIHAWGLALLIIALVQLMLAWLLDYSKPLATVQRQLLRLRRVRVWGERWLLVAGFAVWMPLVFAGLATFGLDVWELRPSVVWFNLAFALALSGGVAWYSLRCRERFERDALGRSLRAAQAELDELAGE